MSYGLHQTASGPVFPLRTVASLLLWHPDATDDITFEPESVMAIGILLEHHLVNMFRAAARHAEAAQCYAIRSKHILAVTAPRTRQFGVVP